MDYNKTLITDTDKTNLNKIRINEYPLIDNLKITGSGIGIIETNQFIKSNGETFNDIVILLARDGNPNIYSIFGGCLDVGQSIKSTAIEELKQESLNMFNFNDSDLDDCSYTIISGNFTKNNRPPDHGYLCYFVHSNEQTNLNIYFENMNKIMSHKKIPRCFLETNHITKLSLSQFITDFNVKGICHLQTSDIYNNKVVLRARDCAVLYNAFKQNIFNINETETNFYVSTNLIPKQLVTKNYTYNTITNNNMSFLKNTITYVIE